MKKIREIGMKQSCKALILGVLTLIMLTLICIPQMITVAGAQKYANHGGWYSGMSYLAEQEIRAEQQKEIAEKEKGETNFIGKTTIDFDKNDVDSDGNCRLTMLNEDSKC